jgi:hypothetical protein
LVWARGIAAVVGGADHLIAKAKAKVQAKEQARARARALALALARDVGRAR